ncbi:MAG: type II secretion system protein GspG [Planctomycetota bacterium]|nr:MAG: type II secretion system protein GspG [Planctomycetota bacterium]
MVRPLYSETPSRRRRAGFTLIEIMVVITLIGLIATIVVPGVMEKLEQGRVQTSEAKITVLGGVLDSYRMHHGKYPDTLSQLLEPNDKNLGQPYVKDPGKFKDAWDRDFIYTKSSSRDYEIVSLGADGLEGGEHADADISSDKSKMLN